MGWVDLVAHAGTQYGVIARWQCRSFGVDRKMLARRVRRGEVESVTAVVLRLHGTTVCERQCAMAAVLDAGPGAVLSHHAAAALWKLPGFRLNDLHVTRRRSGTRRGQPLARVHQPCRLLPRHVTTLERLPLTTPARTLFDLAGACHPKRVERALEIAWSKRLVDGVRLAAILDDLGKRGRAGTTVVRELLANRGPDYIPPDSGLEGRFRDLLERAGLPPMQRQIDVGGDRWLARVDFHNRELGLIVQIDSELYHSALIDKRTDDEQTEALRRAGFEVLRFTDFQVWYRADEVIAQLQRAVLARQARRKRRD